MPYAPCSWEPQPNGTPGLMALHLRAMDAIHAAAPGTVYLIEVGPACPLGACSCSANQACQCSVRRHVRLEELHMHNSPHHIIRVYAGEVVVPQNGFLIIPRWHYRVAGSRRWAPTGAMALRATRRCCRVWASATRGPSSIPWSASRTPVRRA